VLGPWHCLISVPEGGDSLQGRFFGAALQRFSDPSLVFLKPTVATPQHPESLNAWQRYKQARALLRQTTRASNPAWYQDAVDLDCQLHIRVDGPTVSSWLYIRANDQWSAGPQLDEICLRDPLRMAATATEVLQLAQALKAHALGIILHLADEFVTAELKPELNNPAALPDLRDTAIVDPLAILDDSSVSPEQSAWRVLPYLADGSPVIGTTITVTRKYAPFFETLREVGETNNFPLITRAVSAPLVATMGLSQWLSFTPGKPFVAVLQYPWFTVLEFFNEHADLRLIRTLQHRHLQRATNLRHAVITTNASLEFINPDIFILPLCEAPDTLVQRELTQSLPGCQISEVIPPVPEGIPKWSVEPGIIGTPPAHTEHSGSATFETLRAERWALQDFLPTPRVIAEVYPTRHEMKLLRVLLLSRVALVLVSLLILAWFAFGVYEVIRHDEWAFDPTQTDTIKQRLSAITAEGQKIERWDSLLEDRSKAWVSMELLSRMFPERCGVLIKGFAHTVRPDQAPGQAKVGLVKEWKITGLARDEAVDRLNEINSQDGINAQFAEIARVTGNTAFNPAIGNRSLSVNVRTQENSSFKALPAEEIFDTDESTYAFSFELTITQRFEATDPMAIIVSKAP
jgi:hypothetical protein